MTTDSHLTIPLPLKTQGPILESEISVGELTLNPGNWEVFWYAELDTVGVDPLNPNNATGDSVKTCYSASATFRVTGKCDSF